MSNLKAFLQPLTEQTKEVIVSDRFKDEDGNSVPFVIKTISQEENERLIKLSTRKTNKKDTYFDNVDFLRRIVVSCTVSPDFATQEICEYFGVVNPLDAPVKMLSIKEYKILVDEILDLNEFGETQEKYNEAKNF